MKPSSSRTMQPALDVLRILAALMVLTVHTGQLTGLEDQTAFGANGVILFFILSGYLTQISLERTSDISAYYRRRALRILPLYWLTLAVRYLYDMVFALAAGVPAAEIFSLQGVCGPRWLRYVFFLQMWIPSDDWMLWNNRNVLWTMSAFAFFYLAAPWIHRLVQRFRSRFAASFILLLLCIAGKGTLGSRIEASLSTLPQGSVDQISEFSAKMPLMVLYAFLFGTTLYWAVREGYQLFYGGFCLLLPAVFGFERMAYEGAFTVLLLLAVQWPGRERLSPRVTGALHFLSAGSFFLYLAHPMLLGLLPILSADTSGWMRWGMQLAVTVGCCVACYLLYALVIRRYEKAIARLFSQPGKSQ